MIFAMRVQVNGNNGSFNEQLIANRVGKTWESCLIILRRVEMFSTFLVREPWSTTPFIALLKISFAADKRRKKKKSLFLFSSSFSHPHHYCIDFTILIPITTVLILRLYYDLFSNSGSWKSFVIFLFFFVRDELWVSKYPFRYLENGRCLKRQKYSCSGKWRCEEQENDEQCKFLHSYIFRISFESVKI